MLLREGNILFDMMFFHLTQHVVLRRIYNTTDICIPLGCMMLSQMIDA